MLLLDLVIAIAYLSTLLPLGEAVFSRAIIIMLFFLAIRVLALTIHPLISLLNLFALPLLWQSNISLLVLLYLGYSVLYSYLHRKEMFQTYLEKENTRLQIESQHFRRYQLLHERYEDQLEENLRLDERRKISQEIHDLLGHTIAAAILQLEAAKSLIAQSPEQARDMVGDSAELLRDGMGQIRTALKAMHARTEPVKLSTIELLIGKVMRDTGLQIVLLPQGDHSRLSAAHWKAIYQTVGEALSNVVRHAQAGSVRIELHVMPKLWRLSIADDGVGADNITEGMGLQGIRERIEELGGTMTLESERGLRINCLVPLERSQP